MFLFLFLFFADIPTISIVPLSLFWSRLARFSIILMSDSPTVPNPAMAIFVEFGIYIVFILCLYYGESCYLVF